MPGTIESPALSDATRHPAIWQPLPRSCSWPSAQGGGVTTTGGRTGSHSRGPVTNVGSPALTLQGAGSTFDAPFFDLAFARYHRLHPGVAVSYSAVGSSDGILAFTGNRVDFGASDVPMTPAEQAAAKGGPSVQVPVDLGA